MQAPSTLGLHRFERSTQRRLQPCGGLLGFQLGSSFRMDLVPIADQPWRLDPHLPSSTRLLRRFVLQHQTQHRTVVLRWLCIVQVNRHHHQQHPNAHWLQSNHASFGHRHSGVCAIVQQGNLLNEAQSGAQSGSSVQMDQVQCGMLCKPPHRFGLLLQRPLPEASMLR